jgi:hypothetical protein
MNPRAIRYSLFALLIIGAAGVIRFARRDNERLRHDLAQAERRRDLATALRVENLQTKALLKAADVSVDASQTWAAEAARLREEIAAHERDVEERRGRGRTRAAAVAANRDPLEAPMRLSNLQNLGRENPSDALQTLLWAALKVTMPGSHRWSASPLDHGRKLKPCA